MAKIILFHHAHGLTDGVEGFADELRAGSHEVITPDLFEGRVFETVEEGVSHADQLGFDNILASAREIAQAHDEEVVYAGFSLGALAAHMLAQTRPGAAGALLFHHGDVAMTTFGEEWPGGVDFQIHVNQDDPYCELEVVREFVQLTGAAAVGELFVYPGSTHLFTDTSLSDYEPTSASLVLQRALEFLERLG